MIFTRSSPQSAQKLSLPISTMAAQGLAEQRLCSGTPGLKAQQAAPTPCWISERLATEKLFQFSHSSLSDLA